jgi:O-antigen ligase
MPGVWRWLVVAMTVGVAFAALFLAKQLLGGNVSGVDRGALGTLNPNFLAYCFATAYPFVLFEVARGENVHRIARIALRNTVALLIVVGIFATGSRGSLLVITAVTLVKVYVDYSSGSYWTVLVYVVFGATGGFFLYEYLPDDVINRIDIIQFVLTRGENVNSDLSGRLDVWPRALELFLSNLLVGVGAGGFSSMNPLGISAHNFILSLAAETGVFGLVAFCLALLSVGVGAWSSLRRASASERGLCVCVLLTWLVNASSGVWEFSVIGWLSLALVSRMPGRTAFARG